MDCAFPILMLGMKVVKVPVDPKTFACDVDAVRRAISANTVMLYASAPSFPQGNPVDMGAAIRCTDHIHK